jgi:hypothetical protein
MEKMQMKSNAEVTRYAMTHQLIDWLRPPL